ncbi:MAG TPA: methyltransferase domain-containing protein [Candidatus Cybelea sp.]|nr:methyltransferase domain-containing protein [Candidatus Cybelea sp.]
MSITGDRNRYLPAAGRDWALPLYDPLQRLLGGDAARRPLLDQAVLAPGQRVLDIGCGTGTLAALLKSLYPEVHVVGLDPDPKALARAGRKAARAGFSIRFDRGFSGELPYADASFDRVFSSYMFHHLNAGDRQKTLREVRRVLGPAGSFHMVDFVRPEAGAKGWSGRLLGPHAHFRDNSDSQILALLGEAAFACAQKVAERALLGGLLRLSYYRAVAPS